MSADISRKMWRSTHFVEHDSDRLYGLQRRIVVIAIVITIVIVIIINLINLIATLILPSSSSTSSPPLDASNWRMIALAIRFTMCRKHQTRDFSPLNAGRIWASLTIIVSFADALSQAVTRIWS